MFSERLKRCALVFIGIIVFAACTGLFMPGTGSIFTDSDQVVSERVLVPGGQSVGIQMDVKGALIVGVEKQAGAQVGDMIVAVNGTRVDGPEDVNQIVSGSRKKVNLTVIRDNKAMDFEVTPYFDRESREYKLGLWIKERIAGIGTLTFYDPKTGGFAALGHGIYEGETGLLLQTKSGTLQHTRVNQIKVGQKGEPGEIGGVVYDFQNPIGQIKKNTEFGIYGAADSEEDFYLPGAMVMAPKEEIEKGRAYMLTTVDGTTVEKFEIEITKVHHQSTAHSKGLEFEIVDKKLLSTCGGIVQGMSGSPIIQNNRIVGAVTHVFVNNPKKGYGIFAEWMVEELEE